MEGTMNISQWAEEDKPREKLMLKGRNALSDAELLAIILGSGSRQETAVTLAQRILQHFQQDLNALGKSNVAELTTFKGMGEAKAIAVMAAMELGRRKQEKPVKERIQVKSSKDAYQSLFPHLADLPHEEFWVLYLNRGNKIMHKEQISRGGMSGTIADAKVIFKKALECNAAAIILAHNHPSGNLKPSDADLQLTKNIQQAGKVMEINVLDHLILSEQGYYSFADEGKM
jgi:DNA repair protein RadC